MKLTASFLLIGFLSRDVLCFSLNMIKDLKRQVMSNEGDRIVGINDMNGGKCETKPFKQSIRFGSDCEVKYINNNYCFGQCSTLYIPTAYNAIHSCRQCSPHNSTLTEIPIMCQLRKQTILVVEGNFYDLLKLNS